MKYLKRFNESLSAIDELKGRIYNRLTANSYEKLEYWGRQDDITPKEDKNLDRFVDKYVRSKGFPLAHVDKQKYEMTHREGLTDYRREYVFDLDIPFKCDITFQKLEDDIWLIEFFMPDEPNSKDIRSKVWVCDSIDGVEECLKENF